MTKILIIGQAPADKIQDVPYDTTLLYEWLAEIDISKAQAQKMFQFEAMTDEFPGRNKSSGHKPPSKIKMDAHYRFHLKDKIRDADKIILLGAVPQKYFEVCSGYEEYSKLNGKRVLQLLHPSRRNLFRYRKEKDTILKSLKEFINPPPRP